MSDVEKDQIEEALETQDEAEEINESVEVECSPEEALEKATDEIQRLTEYAEEMKDEALRAKAEMENIRKRAERDVQNARKFGIEKFAKELLPVTSALKKLLSDNCYRRKPTNFSCNLCKSPVKLQFEPAFHL